ncbi:MAG: DUF4349 domain-containing protein [Bacillota bacterium]
MKKLSLLIALLILVGLLAGCGGRTASVRDSAGTNSVMPEIGMSGSEGKAAADGDVYYDAAPSPRPPIDTGEAAILPGGERQVIKNAEVTLNVADLMEAARTIEVRVDAMGGMVTETNISNNAKDQLYGYLTLRVPSSKFAPLMTELAQWGEIETQRTYTQDVTEQYIDLEARTKNLKEQEQRLRDILAKASTVEEILKVERELERVRGESESLTGRFNYLRNRVDYSSISLQLREVSQELTVKPLGMADLGKRSTGALIKSLNGLLNALGNLVVFLFAALPVLIVIILLVLLGWIAFRKYVARNRSGDLE